MYLQINKMIRNILLLASALGLVCFYGDCGGSYRRRVISDKPARLTPDWIELSPEQPLGCEMDTHELVLELATPFKLDTTAHPAKMILEDNSTANPEIQVTDIHGRAYSLPVTSFSLPESVVYTCNVVPSGTKINSVKIRSDKPLELSSLQWLCYNFRDVKR